MKHLFDASLRKNGNSRKSFGFRKHEINVQLFQIWFLGSAASLFDLSTKSLGVGTTFSWTRGLACRAYLAD